MKKTQFEKMTVEDLKSRAIEMAEELSAGRMKMRLGQFRKTSEFPRLRKEIARIQTELSSRRLNSKLEKSV